MAFYFSSVTKALYDTDVFPAASLPANKVEITKTVYTELMTKQNQGYVIMADNSGNPYTVNQSEASATDIKHAASVANTLALGHVKIGNTMTAANDGTLDVKDDAITAEKVKDNETLPVNVSGSSSVSKAVVAGAGGIVNAASTGYSKLAEITFDTNSEPGSSFMGFLAVVNWRDTSGDNGTGSGLLCYSNGGSNDNNVATRLIAIRTRGFVNAQTAELGFVRISDTVVQIWANIKSSWSSVYINVIGGKCSVEYFGKNFQITQPANYTVITYRGQYIYAPGSVGTTSIPVYVDSNGQVQPCDASPFIIDKIVNEDGSDIVIYKSLTLPDSSTWVTLGKLNITPSNKNCIVDFTFMMHYYEALNAQGGVINSNVRFGVFVGNTLVEIFPLLPSTEEYKSSPSFRCTFSANINDTIYIKISRSSSSEPHTAYFAFPKVKGLAFYKD